MVVKVSKEQAKKIKTPQDLQRFYYQYEKHLTEEEVVEMSYDFPEGETARIDALIERM